ncbi:MAG TPA: SDR family NAD(P)-dependent oxidoreductase [Trichocoleus sp.]
MSFYTKSATSCAIVTGANRGIGLEVVRQLAHKGMTVILGSRDLQKGEMAAAKLTDEGLQVLPRQLDVTDFESITRLAAQVEQEFGRLDILVNNAGILYDTWQQPSTANLDTVQEAINTLVLQL